MTERAENRAGERPSGGRGPRFESGHSEGVAGDAATLAATPPPTPWAPRPAVLADHAGASGVTAGRDRQPFPECEHYEFPPESPYAELDAVYKEIARRLGWKS